MPQSWGTVAFVLSASLVCAWNARRIDPRSYAAGSPEGSFAQVMRRLSLVGAIGGVVVACRLAWALLS
jgi:hypothetical protein